MPLPRAFDGGAASGRCWRVLLVVLVVTDRSDAVLRDPVAPLRPRSSPLLARRSSRRRCLLALHRRGASTRVILAGLAALGARRGRDRLPGPAPLPARRFRNDGPETAIPGMHLDSAYRWARDIDDARIGLAGTTAGFLQYGFYGTDLSNRVVYLGEEGPHGAFNAIPTCRGVPRRGQRRRPRLPGHLALPQLHPPRRPDRLARGALAARRAAPSPPVLRSGPVTVWKRQRRARPAACGPGNAPLREIPTRSRSA